MTKLVDPKFLQRELDRALEENGELREDVRRLEGEVNQLRAGILSRPDAPSVSEIEARLRKLRERGAHA